MKRLLIIGAILYCLAPDLFYGPIDDALILLGSMICAAAGQKDRDPEYMKMYRKHLSPAGQPAEE